MLSPATIARYVTSKRTDQLLEAVIANGQYLPVMLKVWLSEVGLSPALSLGLKRVVELSRRPTPAAEMLTQTLLASQSHDGGFEHDPLATAIAAAALFQLMHDHHTHDPATLAAHRQAISFIKHTLSADGLFYEPASLDPTRRLLFTAYILQLLARDLLARQSLSLDDLLCQLELTAGGVASGQSNEPTRPLSASCKRDVQSFLRIARTGMPRTAAAAA